MKRTALTRGTTPLRRSAPKPRTTRIRPRSARKIADDLVLACAKALVRQRSRGLCEAPEHCPSCSGRGEHVHHRLLRSQGGTHDPSNLVDLSRACHEHWHAHPARARELGVILARGADRC